MKHANRSWAWPVATALWAALLAGGSIGLGAYANRQGEREAAPSDWPSDVLGERTGELELALFAHPHCPCTRASLWEADELAADSSGRLAITVWFFVPEGEDEDWAHGDLWRLVEASPAMRPRVDVGGRIAERVGARTSGHALLFDAHGSLRFDGGLTPTRGHQGDFYGTDAIEDLIARSARPITVTPVFGCGIQDEDQ